MCGQWQWLNPDACLPTFRLYMGDITTMTTTTPRTRKLLRKLEKNFNWARVKIKPSKLYSFSLTKGVLTNLRLFFADDPIPTVSEQPVKSLGRLFDENLKDQDQLQQLQELGDRLRTFETTKLQGRLETCCSVFSRGYCGPSKSMMSPSQQWRPWTGKTKLATSEIAQSAHMGIGIVLLSYL